jgi:hypothetical protein
VEAWIVVNHRVIWIVAALVVAAVIGGPFGFGVPTFERAITKGR